MTIDGVWTDDQSQVVKYLLSRDRGRLVRSEAGYRALASKVFSSIESSIRHDLLRIPYTLLILKWLFGDRLSAKKGSQGRMTIKSDGSHDS